MVKLITSSLLALKSSVLKSKRLAAELILGALLALSVSYGTIVYNQNKSLSESLESAQNNIEVYQDIVSSEKAANGVLKLHIQDIQNSNDKLIQQIDSVRKINNIKPQGLTTAATQTQTILVKGSKGVKGDIIEILKDSVYKDSIKYNSLTDIYYCIGKDTVDITLSMQNTQYLYTYKTREYKNKKNFFKRLFTWDFKKIDKYKYEIINTNDLLKESDIRIIEIE